MKSYARRQLPRVRPAVARFRQYCRASHLQKAAMPLLSMITGHYLFYDAIIILSAQGRPIDQDAACHALSRRLFHRTLISLANAHFAPIFHDAECILAGRVDFERHTLRCAAMHAMQNDSFRASISQGQATRCCHGTKFYSIYFPAPRGQQMM